MITQKVEVVIRYCEDCRWYSNRYSSSATGNCSHPLVDRGNLVTRNAAGSICAFERGQYGSCGPDARYFERKPFKVIDYKDGPKRPWWRFW